MKRKYLYKLCSSLSSTISSFFSFNKNFRFENFECMSKKIFYIFFFCLWQLFVFFYFYYNFLGCGRVLFFLLNLAVFYKQNVDTCPKTFGTISKLFNIVVHGQGMRMSDLGLPKISYQKFLGKTRAFGPRGSRCARGEVF